MKILIINDFIKYGGGAESFVHRLKEVLERKNHKVEIFGSSGKENVISWFSRWYSLKWYKKTIKKIKKFGPEIVHVNNCTRIISPSVIDAALDSKIPVVFTFHDFHYLPPKPNLSPRNWIGITKRILHRKILKNRKIKFISPSKILAGKMENSFGILVKVIPNGVNIPKEKTNYQKNILFVGELSRGKGLQTISNVINKIKNYKVRILGKGVLKKELESKYKNIKFLGFQKPGKFYQNSSIMVFPSIAIDNFPISTLEAMSYGICVIGSKIGGVPEQIKHMETGLLFKPGNVGDFKKNLDYLIKNPKEIKRIGNNARKFAKKNFDWNVITKKYEKVYRETINKK